MLKDFGVGTKVGELVADEAWQAATTDTASGTFFQLDFNGIVCITTPCFNINEYKLNSNRYVTLSAIGGPGKLVEGAYEAMSAGPILVVGRNRIVRKAGPQPAVVGDVKSSSLSTIRRSYTKRTK